MLLSQGAVFQLGSPLAAAYGQTDALNLLLGEQALLWGGEPPDLASAGLGKNSRVSETKGSGCISGDGPGITHNARPGAQILARVLN